MNEFNNLPTPVKIGAGALGVVTIGGATFFFSKAAMLIFFGVLALLLLLFVGGWLVWRSALRRKRNARISGGLADDGRATPKGISDPAKRAELDDLRKKFLQGVNEYRSRGKDLYKLPWYVICGPPGAGKTEAIRRCNVGFPPGMQDGLQGVGGTINMNWWFTNHAVILDTAGKMMFKEVSPGETSEWREFLTLLKKSRPNCPINGLFLAISVEDLIKDSSEKILQKAGKIAQQLDVIQRVLDVRFPVYVIVTKCDLLTGFREFFDDITDPQLQHQMVGWSNPDTLDTPFRPELIDQHLKSVSQRLRGRRLGLLRDPVPESTDRRRTDEVDAMFALPNSLSMIGPRLKRYLETIFVAGEWSAKPLFLRGIYFTSSMREGSALDEELAQAIGVPVGELPDGRGWERERSYFLRDLFMEKAFEERGLVTVATNTGQMLRRRRAVLYGTGFAFLALFAAFCFWGKNKFDKAIGEQRAYWAAAGLERKIVSAGVDHSRNKVSVTNYGEHTSAEFHRELKRLATNEINYGIFRLFARDEAGDIGEKKRLQAQAAAFERDVILPLVTEARAKMDSHEAVSSPAETEALKTLLQMEARLSNKKTVGLLEREAVLFVNNLMAYVTGGKGDVDTNLAHTMSWLYTQGAGANDWPPSWLAVTNAEGTNLLLGAFGRLLDATKQSAQSNKAGQVALTALFNAFEKLNTRELKLVEEINRAAQSGTKLDLASYESEFKDWERALNTARSNVLGKFPTAALAFDDVVQRNLAAGKASMEQAESILSATAKGQLFNNLTSLLATEKTNLNKQLTESSGKLGGQLREMDTRALAAVPGSPNLLYQARAGIYRIITQIPPETGAKIGGRFAEFTKWQAQALTLHDQIAKSGVDAELIRAATNYLHSTTRSVAGKMLSSYVQGVTNQILDGLAFPVLRFEVSASGQIMSVEQVREKMRLLTEVEADLQAPASASLMALQPDVSLSKLNTIVRQLRVTASALVGEATAVTSCRVTLLYRKDDKADDWRGRAVFAAFNGTNSVNLPYAAWQAGEVALDQPVALTFYGNKDMTEVVSDCAFSHKTWGPIQMLHSEQVQEDTDPVVRKMIHPLKDNQSILFELRFSKPLPSLREWPTKALVTEGLKIQP